jgi:starch phosphorylase
MSRFQTFQVYPRVPASLAFLEKLTRNLWWCWNIEARELFRRIDPVLWERCHGNPILFTTRLSQERLENLSGDESFLAHLERVRGLYEIEVDLPAERARQRYHDDTLIAYFSMEFGIHESLFLFAGGLGVLAGDHLKAASDMGVPLVGVGLLFHRGYFHQFLDQTGWQQETYPETDLFTLPLRRAKDPAGEDVMVRVDGPDGPIHAAVWCIDVGRVPLYLLDTNIPENPSPRREITDRLYVGEGKRRLAQEVLLGIGGLRALEAMDLHPTVLHLNEGHCAFAAIERLAQTMERHGVDVAAAREIVPRTTVFTTHTPVAAGHDEFPVDLVRPYLAPFAHRFQTTVDEILSWGRAGSDSPLSMFVLGMRYTMYCNGVSELHGATARRMWAHIWPGRPEDEVPIGHVTNGVHVASWISEDNARLFERYLGPDWYLHTSVPETFNRIDQIYNEELWRAHEMARSRLIRTCRRLMVRQYSQRNAPKAAMQEAEAVLDQEILTIGFARRFATYKRATLLLQDPERLEALITSQTRPVQLIFAGKAHPRDNEGKALIQKIVQFAQRANVRHRVVFIEDYGIHFARHLVQGCDVWLNTPRRPYEACGTSGMKAAANGVLNLSVLDGWWCEGYRDDRGWRIGSGEQYEDPAYQDAVEGQALYNILENDVVPTFYDRRNGDAPGRWIAMMKASMKMAISGFCAHRMMANYDSSFYRPADENWRGLLADGAKQANALYTLRERLAKEWHAVTVAQPLRSAEGPLRVGDQLTLTTTVHLGNLKPDEVDVELYYGVLKSLDALKASHVAPMRVIEDLGDGRYTYECTILSDTSGRYGFTARVLPRGDALIRFMPGLITWA